MEQELNSLLVCEGILTSLKKDSFEATTCLLQSDECKLLQQQYERNILIPYLQSHPLYNIFVKASEGDAESQYQLGIQLNKMEWLLKAANQEHIEAMCQMGKECRKQNDNNKALNWYRLVIKKQPTHVFALESIASILYNQRNISEKEIKEGIECAIKGYSLGSLECWSTLSLFYCWQDKNDEAFAIRSQLVHQTRVPVHHAWQYNYAMCFEHGWGTQQDFKQAREWYEKAKANGSKAATKVLEKDIFQDGN